MRPGDRPHPRRALGRAHLDQVDRGGPRRLRHDRLGRGPDLLRRRVGQLAQALERCRGQREAEGALAAAEALAEGPQLGVQGVDRVGGPDRLAEVDLAAVAQRLDLGRLAVAQDDRGQRQLVEQRLQRVGDREARGRVEVAAAGDDVDRLDVGLAAALLAQLGDRPRRHQVRLAGARADPEHREPAGGGELVVSSSCSPATW